MSGQSNYKSGTTSSVTETDFPWLSFGWSAFGWTIAAALAILGWQVYSYLRVGVWPVISVVRVLRWTGSSWALAPTDWIGIHEVLSSFSLPVFFVLTGLLALLVSVEMSELGDRWKGINPLFARNARPE